MREKIEQENREVEFSEELYFIEVFDQMPYEVISDEYYDKNAELFSTVSNIFYDINQRSGKLPPKLARKIIEEVFSSIQKIGLR